MDGAKSGRPAWMAIRCVPDKMQGEPMPNAANLQHKEFFSEN